MKKQKTAILLTSFLILLLYFVNPAHAVVQDEDTGNTPAFVAGCVLVKFEEGAEPEQVLEEAGVEVDSVSRLYSVEPAIAKFKEGLTIERDSGGWYWFRGKQSREFYLLLFISEILHHEGQIAAILGIGKRMQII